MGVVIEVPSSPRSLTPEQARPIFERCGSRAFALTCDKPADAATVALLESLDPYALQLTGREPEETVTRLAHALGKPVFKSIHLPPRGEGNASVESALADMERYATAGATGFVLDTAAKGLYGGTGLSHDWELAARIVARAPAPVLMAGGINPYNVTEAAAIPGLYGIDLASGVEDAPGVKSEQKLAALFTRLGRAPGGAGG
ncbi:MAG: phosphoribosylanthranilate isomerase [Nitrospinae bacterium]|nr:phosphoribosylanthranilate isomerase [Nitrospinota bacterium]